MSDTLLRSLKHLFGPVAMYYTKKLGLVAKGGLILCYVQLYYQTFWYIRDNKPFFPRHAPTVTRLSPHLPVHNWGPINPFPGSVGFSLSPRGGARPI
jgi:hypothetical protein